MSLALAPAGRERHGKLPAQLVGLLRPELPGLAEEIVTEIRRTLPELAQPGTGPYRVVMRASVEQVLASFVDQIAAPSSSPAEREEMCRVLGRSAAHEGRSLDGLQAAYRVGAQLAWRRAMRVGERHNLSSFVMSSLAEALFGYINELATLSREGYAQAKARPAQEREERRRRLLHLIVEHPAASGSAIGELAESAGWAVPGEVTPVAVQPDARCAPGDLDPDVLADLDGAQPIVLIPGRLDDGRRAMLEAALAGNRAAAGVCVPPSDAADSLRWARRALALAGAGVIGGGPLTLCDEHLLTLWLASDPALLDQLSRRRLAALEGLTRGQRRRVIQTLGAWLEASGNAVEVAGRLHLHPQTVRYRMRQIRETLGDQLDDVHARFGLELAVRATRLRDTGPAGADRTPSSQT
ncbi:helix-turn-helix domain-containing protein [Actinomadura scrupuli]|uniref:helix-turn-helix domain-containing protein n=1 Tax=Actinomadura scrupuli TaxID=559629 RepID=UPI003D98FF44